MPFVTLCAAVVLGQRSVTEPAGFYADFLGRVRSESRDVKFDGGVIRSTVFYSSTGPDVFQVVVTPLPAGATTSKSVAEVLSAARDGTLTMDRLKVESEQNLEVGGHPAKRFMVKVPDGPLMVQMLVLKDNKLFHVLAVLEKERELTGINFVRSFTFLGG